ncbi:DNA repair helicase (nucleomorph) [Chroomonas mesostigmatica CCMP1168]|uniref:DNA 3'-5' helicase n=1 Tax=Chroomonas mesostigmatica CCMP1168 TaxID=1195612 RepID=J7G3D6_9CRYP|nr:DNA repair helicase [Chroomonas mesostigmatica CCMP1168]
MLENNKPLWVFPDGYILFEKFLNFSEEVGDFLISIAEPISRKKLIHEYVLTPYSLYAAITSGISSFEVIKIIRKLSKNLFPKLIFRMINISTRFFGKINLILFKNKYFIYAPNLKILRILLNDDEIGKNLLSLVVYPQKNLFILKKILKTHKKDFFFLKKKLSFIEFMKNLPKCLIFSIDQLKYDVQDMKKRCVELDCPLLEEYDFINDFYVPNIKLDLNPISTIRKYQEKAIFKMFNRGRARSGVIVLPCGAGKTIVGITAVTIVKKTALIVCNSTVSVEQWKKQFIKWSNISPKKIKGFVSGQYQKISDLSADIIITTYSMISFSGQRAKLSASLLNEIKSREWGIVILDEVHIVPATIFRKVLGIIKSHCKLGLTATLLREDRKVGDIGFLIGPKLFETNWLDLEHIGFLATARCAEICCQMPSIFFKHYLSKCGQIRKNLCALNPTKARICDFLIRYHESRGDRILVFSDNVFALRSYATKMKKAFIYGTTGSNERIKILKNFQEQQGKTLFISRIGDTSIDLPEANVILQISSHYGSRRQEAQRLGRILRPKIESKKAFFYSLISSNTEEIFYAKKRQQFLISQGYDFKTILDFDGIEKISGLIFETEEEKELLLFQILSNHNIVRSYKNDF